MVNQQKLDIDISNAKKTAIVYDIVYKPLITELLKNAKDRGNPIITGIGMLIKQALVGFNMWYDVLIEDNEDLEQILTLNNL
jgi:shikimate dehydrogenase